MSGYSDLIDEFKKSPNYISEFKYSKESLEKLEKKLGHKYNDKYKQFMREVGAGYFTIDYDIELSIGVTFESFYALNVVASLLEAREENEIPEGHIPFGADNAGNLFCFKKNEERIMFFDHNFNSLEEIAKDFDTFLRLIKE